MPETRQLSFRTVVDIDRCRFAVILLAVLSLVSGVKCVDCCGINVGLEGFKFSFAALCFT